jgi:hypothetical protein
MKSYHFMSTIAALAVIWSFQAKATDETVEGPAKANPVYQMKTAEIVDDQLVFASTADFEEVLNVGFFRVKRPDDIDVAVTRKFAREFPYDPKYNQFGSIDPVSGYLIPGTSQTTRFCLERLYWDTVHWGTEPSLDTPNYSAAIQRTAHQLKGVGMTILQRILERFDLPRKLWSQATAGAIDDEASYYLCFNHYDPKEAGRPFGLGEHTDWGYITVLDVVEEGLEAEINGVWHLLRVEDGYLTINFGEPLQKLLPGVKASKHRVAVQTEKVRTSTVMFLDPRVGPYRASSGREGEGIVWDWDPIEQVLSNGMSTKEYFARQSQLLYGNPSKK